MELIARVPGIRWLNSSSWLHSRPGPIRRVLYPPTDVGPPGLNQITARPRLFQAFPLALQERIAYRSIRPAASSWLEPRVGQVTLTVGTDDRRGAHRGRGAHADAGRRERAGGRLPRDGHRLQVDLARHPLIGPDLLASLDLFGGAPRLRRGFESSLPGLHFVGAMAAQSFGPLMRFVSGTTYAAPSASRPAGDRDPQRGDAAPTAPVGHGSRGRRGLVSTGVSMRPPPGSPVVRRASLSPPGGSRPGPARVAARWSPEPATGRSEWCAAWAAPAYPVCVAKSDEHALALTSRYVQRRLRWGRARTATRRDALIELCRRERLDGWTLIPTDDEDAALIAREHDALGRCFVLTTPPWEILQRAYDKRLAYELAADAGVPVPKTCLLGADPAGAGRELPGDRQARLSRSAQSPAARQGVASGRPRWPARAASPAGLARGPTDADGPGADPGRRAALIRGAVQRGPGAGLADRAAHPPVSDRLRTREHPRGDASSTPRCAATPSGCWRACA